ncbi:MAG: cofactor-independent phosphoglycerate mutase [Clostridiales bacterium]|jgi:2,3-bisphosphoglycerate-independent phosphoglycerate mutase|nr:cofactor-independent phosphoglycerate mutase [Clostridiales bacterium]
MKYVVVLADGMADERSVELGHKSPMEYAHTPYMDALAPYSEVGLVNTIPEGCAKGSDTANLAVLGYNPQKYNFGRSPLEALSMGVQLKESDVTFRMNLVTLSKEACYEEKKILDYSSDEITTEEASILIKVVQEAFGDRVKSFYPGMSYRHLLVWEKGSTNVQLTPPHDILGQIIGHYKPEGDHGSEIWAMMKASYNLLNHHPINEKRRDRGLKPANSIWIWGEGRKPHLPEFNKKYEVQGAVISAVDLIKGIGLGAGMRSIEVEGATGNVHTNYKGKADAAIKALLEEGYDFIYVHLEGPDECGHRGEMDNKILAIEQIDSKIIGPIIQALENAGEDYKLLVLPDHPTPVRLRTHTGEPVPYMIYNSTCKPIKSDKKLYNETYAKEEGSFINNGYELMRHFLKENNTLV